MIPDGLLDQSITLEGPVGETCVVTGIYTSNHRNITSPDQSEPLQTVGLQRLHAVFDPAATIAYTLEWIENLNTSRLILTGVLKQTETRTVYTGSIGLRSEKQQWLDTERCSSKSDWGSRIQFGNFDISIFSLEPDESTCLDKPGLILYKGDPGELIRTRIRNCISLFLGNYIVYNGCTCLDSRSNVVSVAAVSDPAISESVFDLVALPPAPLSSHFTNEVDDRVLSQMVERIYSVIAHPSNDRP